MRLVLITGMSGVGKTEVSKELSRRGYVAVNADGARISAWYENASGRCEGPGLPRELTKTRDWLEQHSWKMSRELLERIAIESAGQTVFICGAATNENEVWDLFTQVICLYLDDEDELRRRLQQRSSNDFGKEPHELEAILRWNAGAKHNYQSFGAIMVDAGQPLSKVVDEITAAVAETTNNGA